MPDQGLHRFPRNTFQALSRLVGVLPNEVVGERRDVLGSVTQRWQMDRDDIQTEEEVLPELALRLGAGQVHVGGGDDPDVDALYLAGADALDLPLL
jgi:hypothetical protein